MSNQEPGRPLTPAALTALPRLEDIPQLQAGGYDPDATREAFESFRRHALQLQAQLRVLQAAGKSANVDPTGHAVRMDALHLIRAAAEFADALERDAQNASAAQIGRTEQEVRRRQRDLQDREAQVERFREESERQRVEILNASKAEARELLANANRDSTAELREAEARGARLLEQSRHQATELTNAARAEVEQTLEWARAQAGAVIARAQHGAEQLLTAAGLGSDAIAEVSDAIVSAAKASAEANRARMPQSAEPAPPPVSAASAQPETAPPPPVPAPPLVTEPEPQPEPGGSTTDEEAEDLPDVSPSTTPELPPVSPSPAADADRPDPESPTSPAQRDDEPA